MATAVRSTLPPSSTSGDVIASNWTPSEMLLIRIEIIVLLCDIVLAGSGVALLATGCQSQRGGGLRPVPPPLNTPLVVSGKLPTKVLEFCGRSST